MFYITANILNRNHKFLFRNAPKTEFVKILYRTTWRLDEQNSSKHDSLKLTK